MIKPDQLMLGNIFRDKLTGQYLRVSDLSDEGKTTFRIIGSNSPLADGWQGIPVELTPEILEKCGFELSKVLEIDNSRMPLKQVQYLHQLQNLYFALTREELEINL